MGYVVLTIAATDSGNGAGVTADLATINDLGVKGVCAVTAVTAQNTQTCIAVGITDKELLEQQLSAIAGENYDIGAIKIGLIPNKKILKTVLKFIKKLQKLHDDYEIPVVWDPVASASTGSLLSTVNYEENLEKILPYVTVFTPNLHEASLLSGIDVNTSSLKEFEDNVKSMIMYFQTKGARNIYLKGGHINDYKDQMGKEKFDNTIVDCIADDSTKSIVYLLSNRTYFAKKPANVHGTGCIVSSAIATMLAKGYNVLDSITYAQAYLTQGIENSYIISADQSQRFFRHRPFENNPDYFPRLAHNLKEIKNFRFNKDDDGFEKCPHRLGLYPVVNSSEWIERLCKAGVKTMQLRIKNATDKDALFKEIKRSVDLGRQYDARVFIDDYWDLAIKAEAYGVHLGQEDLTTANLVKIKISGLRLGVSTHGYAEIARALLIKPSYVALGHIFPTMSKDMPSAPQGVKRLKEYVELLDRDYPTVAIGGIKLDNLQGVLDSNVGSVAVITAITQADDVEGTIQEWLNRVEGSEEETEEVAE